MKTQDYLTRAFFITFALLMVLGAHYFQQDFGGSGLEVTVNNVVWIFFSLLIGLGLWKVTAQKKIYYSAYTPIIFIALGLLLLPVFYANNMFASQSYTRLLGLCAGLLLFFSLQQFNFKQSQVEKLLLLIVCAALIQACFSLTQSYLLTAGNIFGYNVSYGRPYGVFNQVNVLGSFMATSVILCGYLLAKVNDKRLQAFLLVSATLCMWVLVMTVSRTAYLAVVCALFLLAPWAWQRNKKRFTLFLLVLMVGLGAGSLKEELLAKRNVEALQEGGIRTQFYEHSWQMIKQQPLQGHGYGAFERAFLYSKAERIANGEEFGFSGVLTHPHNDLLFWAVEGGVAPIIGILLLVFSFLFLLRAFKLKQALTLLALVFPIALHTQTEYPLYHSALHWLVLIVLVFYVNHQSLKRYEIPLQSTFLLRSTGIMIPFFTLIFMVTNLQTTATLMAFERGGAKDISSLLTINNPLVAEDRISFHLSKFHLAAALNSADQSVMDELLTDLEWHWTQRSPRPPFIQMLHIAYLETGQLSRAKKVLVEANFLFSSDKIVAEMNQTQANYEQKMQNTLMHSAKTLPNPLIKE